MLFTSYFSAVWYFRICGTTSASLNIMINWRGEGLLARGIISGLIFTYTLAAQWRKT